MHDEPISLDDHLYNAKLPEPNTMPEPKTRHDFYFRAAKSAADRLYGDTTVTLPQTLESVTALRDYVALLMDATQESMKVLPPSQPLD